MSWAPCVDDLLPASWNGIPFWVEGDTGTYGRRLITHEYPMRDTAFQEDMGEKNSEWKVKGYLYGQGREAIKDALIASARSGGAGLLVLPAEGSLSSRLVTLQVQRSKDKQVWFDLDFRNCSPPPGYAWRGGCFPASVRRMASRAPTDRRRAVSTTERKSA